MKSTSSSQKQRMAEKTLEDLFMSELTDMYDVEKRLTKALPKMAKSANSLELKNAIEEHLRETEGQIQKLEQVFSSESMQPKAKKCEAMVGILEEGDEIVADFKSSQAIDAAIICAAQKVEHYEIASYGCLQEWAMMLDKEDAAAIFEEILGEEKAADEKLTELARSFANQEAETGEEEDSEDEGDEEDDEDEM